MKTLEEHRITLKKIADLAFLNGLKNSNIDFSTKESGKDLNEAERASFIKATHEGFKKAQYLLIEEIVSYQEEWQKSKKEIKEARKSRDKLIEKKLHDKIKIIEHRTHTLNHIADGIAWTLLDRKLHLVRRLNIDEDSMKILSQSNLKHAIEISNKINEEDDQFALISDLTNFIQIGDLIVKKEGIVGLMELKEGKVNEQIEDFLNDLKAKNIKLEDVNLNEKFDKKTAKQIKRFHRQQTRIKRAIHVMNDDIGLSPKLDDDVVVVATPKVTTDYYYDDLHEMMENLKTKNWDYNIVEGCLHIGMYKNEARKMASLAINQIMKHTTENYQIVDWMNIVQGISEPIFSKPFPPDFLIDILTGKVKIIMAIDYDAMITLFNDVGLEAKWMTRKQTMRRKQETKQKGMVEINKKGIVLKLGNMIETILFDGVITKIFFDNIKPSSIAISFLTSEFPKMKNE